MATVKRTKSPAKKPAPAVASNIALPKVKSAATKPAAVKRPVKPAAAKASPQARPAKTAPAAAPKEQKEKVKKSKLVRDSFTMPEAEYEVLGQVKRACLKAGIEVKKSELLRVGVALIRKLDLAGLKEILAALPPLKTGRPKKN